MNIGEKIRELRVSKLMTQAELAGSRITRNMLSCIENGTAQPSLSTILYIASRLNVPAGFLLAEEGDEIVYRKMNGFENIKSAYVAKDLLGCRSLCLSTCPEPDDEICLLLADCNLGIAKEEFWGGKLHSACRFLDEALEYAERTMYPTSHVDAEARVYFRYLRRLSATLYSDMLDEESTPSVKCVSEFADYTEALEALDDGDLAPARAFVEKELAETFLTEHIRIRLMMEEGDFSGAKEILLQLLEASEPLNKICLYSILCELEVCCRETDDYKGAYNYANEKLLILEEMLKEV